MVNDKQITCPSILVRGFHAACLTLAVLMAHTLRGAEIAFSSTAASGDLTADANWTGGVAPGASDTAKVDCSTAGRTFFWLGKDWAVSANSWFNTSGAILDMMGHAATAGYLRVEDSQSLTLTNGTYNLTTKDSYVGTSSTLRIAKGASLLWPASLGVATIGTFRQNGSKVIIDGGLLRLSNLSTTPDAGFALGNWQKSMRVQVINGGTLDFVGNRGRKALTLWESSTMLVDNGSVFAITNASNNDRSFITKRGAPKVAVTNSTFRFHRMQIGVDGEGNSNARFTFHNSTVSGSASATDGYALNLTKSANGRFLFSGGCNSSFSFRAQDANSTGNTLEMMDGSHSGAVYLAGRNNRYIRHGGSHNGDITVAGATNAVSILGGTVYSKTGQSNRKLAISGAGARVTFADCTAYLKLFDGNPLTVARNTTDAHVVISNATLAVQGLIMPFTNECVDCAFEFCGESPQFRIATWETAGGGSRKTYQAEFGSASAALDGRTVALRFVLPAQAYSSAPIYSEDSSTYGSNSVRPLKLHPNTRIVVDKGAWKHGDRRVFYPLVYDRYAFNGEMTAEAVESLEASASLPEGAHLKYDSASKTLGLEMPPKSGFYLYVR